MSFFEKPAFHDDKDITYDQKLKALKFAVCHGEGSIYRLDTPAGQLYRGLFGMKE